MLYTFPLAAAIPSESVMDLPLDQGYFPGEKEVSDCELVAFWNSVANMHNLYNHMYVATHV